MKAIMPTRALGLLIGIGLLDLLVTAILHANGLIVEMNPLMKPFIERSEWMFAFVKGSTLVAGWAVMVWYARQNLEFVRKVCLYGSMAYACTWLIWFVGGN